MEDAKKSLRARIRLPQWISRERYDRPLPDKVTIRAHNQIAHERDRFAILRAFRAAGIFGNETRNDLRGLIRTNKWEELRQKIGERRTNRIRQVLGEGRMAAQRAEEELFHRDEHRIEHRLPVENPIHGALRRKEQYSPRKKVA
jgi:hypothetical protein